MIIVIFEVWIKEDKKKDYLDIANQLHNKLSIIKGFISIERFQSLSNPHKLLSMSVWQDETAVHTWRNLDQHRQAQAKGIESIFADYRLRICSIIRDYGMNNRLECPADSADYHRK